MRHRIGTRQMAGEAEEKLEEPKPADLPADTPDWLRGLGSAGKTPGRGSALFFESGLGTSEAPTLPPTDMPDWLKTPAEEEKPAQDTTPKWLRGEPGGTAEPETPAWLASEETVHLSTEGEPAQDDFIADLPDWLKAAAPQSSIFDQPAEQPKPETPAETPDWLKPFQAETPQYEATPEPSETPFENAPAFTPDFKTGESDLFAEMPDWLSNAVEPSSAPAPTPITNEDALAPSDLPAWVQAMRPVEPGGIPSRPSFTSDQTLESRGALAGLQGVLPAAPGFAPTSKPKSYSLKLQTSDEQVAHAKILGANPRRGDLAGAARSRSLRLGLRADCAGSSRS
ncbi:MAG: hypothetical protein HND47_04490 [Chloroflexi bacterium]|nr:hypothetical protein [Chloroflexota bacterium]